VDNILAYILRVVDEILFWDDDFVEKDTRLKTFLLSGMTHVRCRVPKLPMMTGTCIDMWDVCKTNSANGQVVTELQAAQAVSQSHIR
jgi:hypothetical protein